MEMRYKVAVFDMDGTILDTLQDLKDSINFALKENGFPERNLEEVRLFVGNGLKKLVERAVPENASLEQQEKVLESFNHYYPEHCDIHTKPYDGILELLQKLKSRGMKLAVNSNKPDYGVKELCKKYFDGIFDVEIGIKEGIKTKPSPDALNKILELLDCEKQDAVYIGDSDVDIMTAKNAELRSISVDWGFRSKDFLKKSGAEKIVENCGELYAELCEK